MKPSDDKILLFVSHLTKSFPGVQALSNIDFDFRAAEVHALVGENGAGKSTLARIIAGVDTPDSGSMSIAGQTYRPRNRIDAQGLGVRMVMQELNLIPTLTMAENIFLEKLPSRLGFINYRKLNLAAKEITEQVGLTDIDPSVPVSSLGIGRQQMVEIAAGLSRKCRILVLDEPTASLTDNEIGLLFAQIRKLKAEGVSVIYISHRIEEVINIADRVTVLRDGKGVATEPTSQLNADRIIRLMVGRHLHDEQHKTTAKLDQVVLRVVGLTCRDKVHNVSFELRRGEILGFAGLMGSGRTETMRALFGADRPDSGQIYLGGKDEPVRINKPSDAVRNGIALLTEDRKEQGLLLPLSVRANISITQLCSLSRFGCISPTAERSVAGRYVSALGIKCSSVEQAVGQLSGGNQQKVVIAKWIYRDSDILIFDEPTRGIDVAARFEIYHMLASQAEKGKAIIVVSSDLKELMAICDRIMVMSAGKVAGIFDRSQWSEEKITAAAFSEYLNPSATAKDSE